MRVKITMSQNYIEKIVQNYSVGLENGYKVSSGDFVSISPAYVMTHDNTGAVIPKFESIGAKKLHNPKQVVFTLDHDIQNKSEANISKYKKIENFASKMGNFFYPAGRGIGHQVMIEEGYILPGSMVVASDSHSNTYGGLGVLGTPIVRTDAAAIWATGKTWWQIPPITKVILTGELNPGVSGKDIILSLCSNFNNSEVLNTIIEFSGSGIENISIDQRLTISNMTTEWGALGGVFPADKKTIEWINNNIHNIDSEKLDSILCNLKNLAPDSDANYFQEIEIDLSTIYPTVTGPHNPKSLFDISKKTKIDKAYLLSCTNGRLEDFEIAADILKNKKIHPDVKFYISAASEVIEQQAKEKGYWQILKSSGAIELPSGCGPCIGLGEGLLEDGEVGISATNRNFKGRMGSKYSEAYLASPATVAHSVIAGYIFNPNFTSKKVSKSIKSKASKNITAKSVDIIEGFPKTLEGRIIFCNQNNMNTDLIYAGKYTYADNFSPSDQANVVMENYDPEFKNLVKNGDILLSGFNFGSGSSREQAATSLKYAGIKLVIAGSFSQTYVRNAINNGFLCIELPELVKDFRLEFPNIDLTNTTNYNAHIDFEKSSLFVNKKEYSFTPFGKAAQEIIVNGGLENFVKKLI